MFCFGLVGFREMYVVVFLFWKFIREFSGLGFSGLRFVRILRLGLKVEMFL